MGSNRIKPVLKSVYLPVLFNVFDTKWVNWGSFFRWYDNRKYCFFPYSLRDEALSVSSRRLFGNGEFHFSYQRNSPYWYNFCRRNIRYLVELGYEIPSRRLLVYYIIRPLGPSISLFSNILRNETDTASSCRLYGKINIFDFHIKKIPSIYTFCIKYRGKYTYIEYRFDSIQFDPIWYSMPYCIVEN